MKKKHLKQKLNLNKHVISKVQQEVTIGGTGTDVINITVGTIIIVVSQVIKSRPKGCTLLDTCPCSDPCPADCN